MRVMYFPLASHKRCKSWHDIGHKKDSIVLIYYCYIWGQLVCVNTIKIKVTLQKTVFYPAQTAFNLSLKNSNGVTTLLLLCKVE
ncbi:hypothetical protein HBA_0613 [Sodalis endosymbiont of Henestaris halophilus]|nr:hypothetical protein HBA_0613 [Sodalis endosymbiont of Henestaris halophilus]